MAIAVSSGPGGEEHKTCCSKNGGGGRTCFLLDMEQIRRWKLEARSRWTSIWPPMQTHQMVSVWLRVDPVILLETGE